MWAGSNKDLLGPNQEWEKKLEFSSMGSVAPCSLKRRQERRLLPSTPSPVSLVGMYWGANYLEGIRNEAPQMIKEMDFVGQYFYCSNIDRASMEKNFMSICSYWFFYQLSIKKFMENCPEQPIFILLNENRINISCSNNGCTLCSILINPCVLFCVGFNIK